MPARVFFFRGLSTYGQDNARWSVFDFGPVYKHIQRELSVRGLDFHPVTGLGAGSLGELADRGVAFLRQHSVWKDPEADIHFLGHSAGGLVARLVFEKLRAANEHLRVKSFLTIASPHRGSQLAQICVRLPEDYRGSDLILKTFGYDIGAKRTFFEELTPDSVNEIFATVPSVSNFIKTGSMVCWSKREDWCLPLRLFYQIKAFGDFKTPSDGIVERDSQAHGDVIAEIEIDHFRQVGLFGEELRFAKLMDETHRFFAGN